MHIYVCMHNAYVNNTKYKVLDSISIEIYIDTNFAQFFSFFLANTSPAVLKLPASPTWHKLLHFPLENLFFHF